jgi:molybdopterin converting factor small subunit
MANTATSVAVYIPPPLRGRCEGAAELDVQALDVQSVLDEIERRFPDLHRGVCDDTGAVRRHINIFVNNNHMRDRDGLGTVLSAGDTVTIMTAVSGG